MSNDHPPDHNNHKTISSTTPSPSTEPPSSSSSSSSSNHPEQETPLVAENPTEPDPVDPSPSVPIANHSTSSSVPPSHLSDYTQHLRQDLQNNLDEFHQSLNSIPVSNSLSPPITLDQLNKLIQDNNQRIINLFEASIQRLLVDALDAIQIHFSLHRCNQQLCEIDKQFLSNATNSNDHVRNRVHNLLTQQRLNLEDEKAHLTTRLQPHYPHLSSLLRPLNNNDTIDRSTSDQAHQPSTSIHTTTTKTTTNANRLLTSPSHQHSIVSNKSSSSCYLDAFIHPSLQHSRLPNPDEAPSTSNFSDQLHPSLTSSSQLQFESMQSQNFSQTSTSPSSPSSKRKRDDLHVRFDYDESLLEEFSIPDSLNYPQYLKRSQNRIVPIQGEIALQQLISTNNGSTGTLDSIIDSSCITHHSYLPNPASFESSFKPPGGSKSSRRQSAILRNLVSAALGKLIAQVTKNQQMHWPGSDTEERLAAIGLQIELLPGSKLTADVLHKGPKNLQLQQCKRILLELELGLIRLKEIKAIPRPLRSSKKRIKASDSTLNLQTTSHHPDHDGFTGITCNTAHKDIISKTSSLSSPTLNSYHGLGKNYENCDPALLALGGTTDYSTISLNPILQTINNNQDDINNQELIQRYMSSNLHPNNTLNDGARENSQEAMESDEKYDIRIEKDHDDLIGPSNHDQDEDQNFYQNNDHHQNQLIGSENQDHKQLHVPVHHQQVVQDLQYGTVEQELNCC